MSSYTFNASPPPPALIPEFPAWAPAWLAKLVAEPNCTCGTHLVLRRIAKWLVFYMPPAECPSLAFYWLRYAANQCDRVPGDAELKRLIAWAENKEASTSTGDGYVPGGAPSIDIDRLYHLIVNGPTHAEFRESSPVRLYDTKERNTAQILDMWAGYARDSDPWVCHGSKDCFYTQHLSAMRARAHIFEQIVPSPMCDQWGKTVKGHLSQHSLDGTGPRLFLVIEFDFVPVNARREPTIWAPLIKACAEKGRDVLDMNAALTAHLRELGPLWMVVFSGGKSLQSWYPCRDTDEQSLAEWYQGEARILGACSSTWCRSQFVRMPDGERAGGARQSIEYFNPAALDEPAPQAT
jgi:hypothetical protein